MSMCPACGAQVQGRFCARCGAPAVEAPQQQQPPQGWQQQQPQQPPQQGWQQPQPPQQQAPQGWQQQQPPQQPPQGWQQQQPPQQSQPPQGWQQQQPPPQQQQQGWQQQPPQQPNYGQPQQGGYQQQPYPQQQQYGQPPPAQSAGMEENVAAALCYLLGLITGVLFLVLEPYNANKTIRFHAFQSIFFNVGYIALWIVLSIVFSILRSVLPYGTWFVFSLISMLFSLAMLGAWVFLMYKAYNRERFKIPFIGDMAEKQA